MNVGGQVELMLWKIYRVGRRNGLTSAIILKQNANLLEAEVERW